MRPAIILAIAFVFLDASALAQESNPDGIIGKPSITILAGLQTGSGDNTVSGIGTIASQKSDFNGLVVDAKIIYPAVTGVSLLFDLTVNLQRLELPETSSLPRQKSNLDVYSFAFGVRFFTQ